VSLLGELTLAFLVETIVLIAFWGGLAYALAAGVSLIAGRASIDPRKLRVPILAGIGASMVTASLAQRFGAGDPLTLAIGRREVPVLWSILGAVAGVLIATLAARRGPRAA
jgi:hypothetical protein